MQRQRHRGLEMNRIGTMRLEPRRASVQNFQAFTQQLQTKALMQNPIRSSGDRRRIAHDHRQ